MDKLCALLKDVDYSQFVSALQPSYFFNFGLTASKFRLKMFSWLKKENPKPSWNVLISALTRIGCHGEAAHIRGIGVHASIVRIYLYIGITHTQGFI